MPLDLAHDVTGSGPLLVLVHGITEDRRAWDSLTAALARDHRVLRVDLRGHGESPDGEAYELADYAGDIVPLVDEPPLVVGHSLGGIVATWFAATNPVRGVLNIDQPLELSGFVAAVRQMEPALRGEPFEATMAGMFEAMRGPVGDADWAQVSRGRSPRREVVLGTWRMLLEDEPAAIESSTREVFGRIEAPYLTLLGTDLGPDYVTWLRGILPQARVETWPGTGHYPHLVHPKRFLELVRELEHADGGRPHDVDGRPHRDG